MINEKSLHKKLLKKKWKRDEVNNALRTLNRGIHKSRRWDVAVFWIALFVSLLGNFLLSIALLPLLLLVEGFSLAIILALVGICFGILFECLICGLGYSNKHHHIIAGIFIPIVALLNTILIINVSNQFISVMHVSASPHFIGMALVYVISIMIPFAVHKVMLKKKMMDE